LTKKAFCVVYVLNKHCDGWTEKLEKKVKVFKSRLFSLTDVE